MIANVLPDIDFIQQLNIKKKLILSVTFLDTILLICQRKSQQTCYELSNVHQMHISESRWKSSGTFLLLLSENSDF